MLSRCAPGAALALEALGRAREEIDAINVYPVADGDTGTNLYLTLESATAAVEAVFAGHEVGAGREATGDEAGGGHEAGGRAARRSPTPYGRWPTGR